MLKFSAADDANSHDASLNETREAQEADLLDAYSNALEQQTNGHVEEACSNLMQLDTSINATNWESDLISNLKFNIKKNVASLLATQEQFQEAQQWYLDALKLNNEDYLCWYRLAQVAHRHQDHALAAYALSSALKHQPDHWPSLLLLMKVNMSIGDVDAASTTAQQVLELDPNNADAKATLVHCQKGQVASYPVIDRLQLDRPDLSIGSTIKADCLLRLCDNLTKNASSSLQPLRLLPKALPPGIGAPAPAVSTAPSTAAASPSNGSETETAMAAGGIAHEHTSLDGKYPDANVPPLINKDADSPEPAKGEASSKQPKPRRSIRSQSTTVEVSKPVILSLGDELDRLLPEALSNAFEVTEDTTSTTGPISLARKPEARNDLSHDIAFAHSICQQLEPNYGWLHVACHVLSTLSLPTTDHDTAVHYRKKLQKAVIVLAHNVLMRCNSILGVLWCDWLPSLDVTAAHVTDADWLCLFLWELCVDHQVRPEKGIDDEGFQALVTQMAKLCHRRSGCLEPDTSEAWLNRFWLVTALHGKIRSSKVVAKLQKAKQADLVAKLTAQRSKTSTEAAQALNNLTPSDIKRPLCQHWQYAKAEDIAELAQELKGQESFSKALQDAKDGDAKAAVLRLEPLFDSYLASTGRANMEVTRELSRAYERLEFEEHPALQRRLQVLLCLLNQPWNGKLPNLIKSLHGTWKDILELSPRSTSLEEKAVSRDIGLQALTLFKGLLRVKKPRDHLSAYPAMATAALASLRPSISKSDMLQLSHALHSTFDGLGIPCSSSSPFLQQTVVICKAIVDELGCTDDAEGSEAYASLAQAYYCMTRIKIGLCTVEDHAYQQTPHDIGMSVEMYRYHCLQTASESFDTNLSWLNGAHIFPRQHLYWQHIELILRGESVADAFVNAPVATGLIAQDQMCHLLATGPQREIILLHLKEHSAGMPRSETFDAFEDHVRSWICYDHKSWQAWFQLGMVYQRRTIVTWAEGKMDYKLLATLRLDKAIKAMQRAELLQPLPSAPNSTLLAALGYCFVLKARWSANGSEAQLSATKSAMKYYAQLNSQDNHGQWLKLYMLGTLHKLIGEVATAAKHFVSALDYIVKDAGWKKSDAKNCGKQYETHLQACSCLFEAIRQGALTAQEAQLLLNEIKQKPQNTTDPPSVSTAVTIQDQLLEEIKSQLIDQYYGNTGIVMYCHLKLKSSQLDLDSLCHQSADASAILILNELYDHVASRFKVGLSQSVVCLPLNTFEIVQKQSQDLEYVSLVGWYRCL
eukprot:m.194621 g.194621  ORF g.194621 m.194621 type:complete len:1265 (+) comp16995_c0_seq17:164-3958(+)